MSSFMCSKMKNPNDAADPLTGEYYDSGICCFERNIPITIK